MIIWNNIILAHVKTPEFLHFFTAKIQNIQLDQQKSKLLIKTYQYLVT